MATLLGVWRYRVSAGTGWHGVSIPWLGEIMWFVTSISVWQHVNLSEQIRPWDTLACCWDVKQPIHNKHLSFALWSLSPTSPTPSTLISLSLCSLCFCLPSSPPPPPFFSVALPPCLCLSDCRSLCMTVCFPDSLSSYILFFLFCCLSHFSWASSPISSPFVFFFHSATWRFLHLDTWSTWIWILGILYLVTHYTDHK